MRTPLRLSALGGWHQGVAGTAHYQDALLAALGGYRREDLPILKPALLICDDENVHDPLAVRVEIESATVGHLPREDARKWRAKLEKAGFPGETVGVVAKLNGGTRTNQSNAEPVTVRVDRYAPVARTR